MLAPEVLSLHAALICFTIFTAAWTTTIRTHQWLQFRLFPLLASVWIFAIHGLLLVQDQAALEHPPSLVWQPLDAIFCSTPIWAWMLHAASPELSGSVLVALVIPADVAVTMATFHWRPIVEWTPELGVGTLIPAAFLSVASVDLAVCIMLFGFVILSLCYKQHHSTSARYKQVSQSEGAAPEEMVMVEDAEADCSLWHHYITCCRHHRRRLLQQRRRQQSQPPAAAELSAVVKPPADDGDLDDEDEEKAQQQQQRSNQRVPIPPRPLLLVICSLLALIATGIRWVEAMDLHFRWISRADMTPLIHDLLYVVVMVLMHTHALQHEIPVPASCK